MALSLAACAASAPVCANARYKCAAAVAPLHWLPQSAPPFNWRTKSVNRASSFGRGGGESGEPAGAGLVARPAGLSHWKRRRRLPGASGRAGAVAAERAAPRGAAGRSLLAARPGQQRGRPERPLPPLKQQTKSSLSLSLRRQLGPRERDGPALAK